MLTVFTFLQEDSFQKPSFEVRLRIVTIRFCYWSEVKFFTRFLHSLVFSLEGSSNVLTSTFIVVFETSWSSMVVSFCLCETDRVEPVPLRATSDV